MIVSNDAHRRMLILKCQSLIENAVRGLDADVKRDKYAHGGAAWTVTLNVAHGELLPLHGKPTVSVHFDPGREPHLIGFPPRHASVDVATRCELTRVRTRSYKIRQKGEELPNFSQERFFSAVRTFAQRLKDAGERRARYLRDERGAAKVVETRLRAIGAEQTDDMSPVNYWLYQDQRFRVDTDDEGVTVVMQYRKHRLSLTVKPERVAMAIMSLGGWRRELDALEDES